MPTRGGCLIIIAIAIVWTIFLVWFAGRIWDTVNDESACLGQASSAFHAPGKTTYGGVTDCG
jgi:hypothetical protein